MSMNAEFLEAQEEKARREAEDEAMGRGTSSTTRKKRKANTGVAGSAAEATLQALQVRLPAISESLCCRSPACKAWSGGSISLILRSFRLST